MNEHASIANTAIQWVPRLVRTLCSILPPTAHSVSPFDRERLQSSTVPNYMPKWAAGEERQRFERALRCYELTARAFGVLGLILLTEGR